MGDNHQGDLSMMEDGERYTCPLEWGISWGPDEDGDESHQAGTPFGSYSVEKSGGRWKWGYCFDEYYDEAESECDDLDAGKRAAQEHWDGRVQPILSRRTLVTP